MLIRLQGMFYPSMTLFLGFGSLLVLWVGSREAIRGRITLGEFVAFNSYLVMLSWPMIAFGWVTNMLQRGMASWKRMLDVIDAVPDISDASVTERGRTVPLTGAIEIRDLTFTYPGTEHPVLEDVSLRIERRADGGIRRRDRFRQVDADFAAAATSRAAAGHGFHGRRRRPRDSTRAASRRYRIRAAGAVPVLRHHCREHRVRRRPRKNTERRWPRKNTD